MSAIIFAIGAGALLPLLSLLLPGWRALTRSPAHPCTHSSAHPPTRPPAHLANLSTALF